MAKGPIRISTASVIQLYMPSAGFGISLYVHFVFGLSPCEIRLDFIHANNRRRRLPAQRLGGRPRWRTDADALQFARDDITTLGTANGGSHPVLSRHPL